MKVEENLLKTMENVKNHIVYELVVTQARMLKCVNNPNYKNCHIINENLAGPRNVHSGLEQGSYA